MNLRLCNLTLLLVTTLFWLTTAEAKIVCWTNNEGIRECGNAIPPEYAQKESEVIDKRGMTVEVHERAKTLEELAAEKAAKEEEERKAAVAEEEKRIKRQKDHVLLSTFLNEEEIERARKRKLSSLEGSIQLTNGSIDKLKEKLNQSMASAAVQERSGKPVAQRTLQEIDLLKRQVAEKEEYIQRQREEMDRLNAKYDADLARFRELKGLKAQ